MNDPKDWLRDVEVPTDFLMQVVEAGYLDEWLRLATMPRDGTKTTSAKAARELCAVASVCLARNHPMPDVVRLYLASALKAGAEGRSVDAALKLGSRKLRKPDGTSKDPMDVVKREQAIAGFVLRMAALHDLPVPKAKELACTEFAEPGGTLDISTVEKILRRYGLGRDEIDDAIDHARRAHYLLAARMQKSLTGIK